MYMGCCSFWLSRYGVGLRVYISDKLSGDGDRILQLL